MHRERFSENQIVSAYQRGIINIVRTLLEGKVKGKLARGGPRRRRQEDNVREWTEYSLAEYTHQEEDEDEEEEKGRERFIAPPPLNLHTADGTRRC